jgi:DNA replication licensing factor MCM4
LETFAKYIKYARAKIHPKITEEAGNAMVDHYVNMRKWGQIGGVSNSNNASSNVVTATTRQLESMIRLSEAHARMRLSPTVDAQDVNEASRLIASAMQKTCIDPLTGRIDMDMITTGLSNKQRTIQSEMRRAVLARILDMERPSIRFIELLRQINDSSSKKVTEYELATVIDALSKEGTVSVRGQSNAEKVIQKL